MQHALQSPTYLIRCYVQIFFPPCVPRFATYLYLPLETAANPVRTVAPMHDGFHRFIADSAPGVQRLPTLPV